MRRINAQSLKIRSLAINALLWITFAKRQLTAQEFQYAVATKPGMEKLEEEDLPDIGDIVAFCAGLAISDENSGIVRLAHYTTQEYLVQTRQKWFPAAESTLAKTCLTYLSFACFGTEHPNPQNDYNEQLQQDPFYPYAAYHWGKHALEAPETECDVLQFLQSSRYMQAASQILLDPADPGPPLTRATGLHLAAYFGLCAAIKVLIQSEPDIDVLDDTNRTPLWYTATKGHRQATSLLLLAGADADLVAYDYSRNQSEARTALEMASRHGHVGVVEELLAAGATPFLDDALYEAVEARHTDIVRKLLHGVMLSRDHWILGIAISNNDVDIVKMLLAAGVNVNGGYTVCDGMVTAFENEDGGSFTLAPRATRKHQCDRPLRVAAENGYTHIVQMLIENGAETNGPCASEALLAAANNGHVDVVNLLLAARPSISATIGDIYRRQAQSKSNKGENQRDNKAI